VRVDHSKSSQVPRDVRVLAGLCLRLAELASESQHDRARTGSMLESHERLDAFERLGKRMDS